LLHCSRFPYYCTGYMERSRVARCTASNAGTGRVAMFFNTVCRGLESLIGKSLLLFAEFISSSLIANCWGWIPGLPRRAGGGRHSALGDSCALILPNLVTRMGLSMGMYGSKRSTINRPSCHVVCASTEGCLEIWKRVIGELRFVRQSAPHNPNISDLTKNA